VSPPRPQRLRAWLAVGATLSALALLINVGFGRIDTSIVGIRFKMVDVARAVALFLVFAIPSLWLTPHMRAALQRRSPLVFYTGAAILFALLACGPELRTGDEVIWKPAPYGWLMMLPGFNELRVPTQLKMIHVLCLAVAAGLAYRAIRPTPAHIARLALTIGAIAILLDGWTSRAEMATAPASWPLVEPPGRTEPILELPIASGDYAATFRAAIHRRRVFNGVSGYDPPHYFALREGLMAHDPAVLTAIAALGDFDIVVDGDADPEGREAQYAAAAPGAVRVTSDGRRTLFRVPKGAADPPLGQPWPIAGIRAVRREADAALMLDGNVETGWVDFPADPDGWVVADLGEVREVGGVTHSIGNNPLDFPRRLVIEVSGEGQNWERVWEGATFAHTFLGFVRESRWASLQFPFAPRPARYVRLRETERPAIWRLQELRVHAPRGEQPSDAR
jgi:hypothetical protein